MQTQDNALKSPLVPTSPNTGSNTGEANDSQALTTLSAQMRSRVDLDVLLARCESPHTKAKVLSSPSVLRYVMVPNVDYIQEITAELLKQLDPTQPGWAGVRQLRGTSFMHLERYGAAIEEFRSAAESAIIIGDDDLQFNAELHEAISLITSTKIDEGLEILEKLRDSLESGKTGLPEDKQKERLFTILCHLMQPYIHKGFFSTALVAGNQALELSTEKSSVFLIQNLYTSLAMVHDRIGSYTSAERFHDLSEENARRDSNVLSVALSMINRVNHRLTHSVADDETLEILRAADEILLKRTKNPRRISVTLCYSLMYILRDELELALEHTQHALEVAAQMGVPTISSSANRFMAMILLKQDKATEALEYAVKSVEYGRLNNKPMETTQSLQILADVYKRMREHQKAFDCLEEIIKIHNDQFGASHKQLHAELQSTVAVSMARHQAENARHEADKQKLLAKQIEIQHQQVRREVVAKALQISETTNLLNALNDTVGKARNAGPKTAKKLLLELSREIKNHINAEQSRDTFEEEFSVLYPNFIDTLSQQFPELTEQELRLCALIRIKLSTDNICRIMRIAKRSIESYRYRIRKKLGLERGEDLGLFLMKFGE